MSYFTWADPKGSLPRSIVRRTLPERALTVARARLLVDTVVG